MKEKGILFSAPMVRAILAGNKTVTRRLAKWPMLGPSDGVKRRVYGVADLERERAAITVCCPQGRVGDRLWVRETWAAAYGNGCWGTIFAADGSFENGKRQHAKGPHFNANDRPPIKWRPSIFLPRWASRITLAVADVRLERLQDISEDDADAEGVAEMDGSLDEVKLCARAKEMGACATDNRVWFAELWDSINGESAAWSSNPYVWAVSFRVVEPKTQSITQPVTASGGSAGTGVERDPQPPAQQPESRLPDDDDS